MVALAYHRGDARITAHISRTDEPMGSIMYALVACLGRAIQISIELPMGVKCIWEHSSMKGGLWATYLVN